MEWKQTVHKSMPGILEIIGIRSISLHIIWSVVSMYGSSDEILLSALECTSLMYIRVGGWMVGGMEQDGCCACWTGCRGRENKWLYSEPVRKTLFTYLWSRAAIFFTSWRGFFTARQTICEIGKLHILCDGNKYFKSDEFVDVIFFVKRSSCSSHFKNLSCSKKFKAKLKKIPCVLAVRRENF